MQTPPVLSPPAHSCMPAANAVCETTMHKSASQGHQQTSPQSLEQANCFNPLPLKKNCVINIDKFEELLLDHPNRVLVDYIVFGLRHGFDTGFRGGPSNTRPKNLKSAYENKAAIQDAINKA